jgi:NDP-sugar pyrophosphorylase family protein
MQVVILAGGLGTRLGPLTQQMPKPMVRVAGIPYLEHQLRLLARQELREIVLLTAYLGEQIEAYFGDGDSLGLSIRYSREPLPLGTGGALRLAGPLLEDTFLVIYGDSYLPVSYADVFRSLSSSAALGALVLYHDPTGETDVPGNVALSKEGLVTRYDKVAVFDPELKYTEAGVLALRRPVIDLIPAGRVSLEREIFPVLIQRQALMGLPTRQRFYDIGTPERLKAIEDLLG